MNDYFFKQNHFTWIRNAAISGGGWLFIAAMELLRNIRYGDEITALLYIALILSALSFLVVIFLRLTKRNGFVLQPRPNGTCSLTLYPERTQKTERYESVTVSFFALPHKMEKRAPTQVIFAVFYDQKRKPVFALRAIETERNVRKDASGFQLVKELPKVSLTVFSGPVKAVFKLLKEGHRPEA